MCHKQAIIRVIAARNMHYGTFGSFGIFRNLYFESRILNPIPDNYGLVACYVSAYSFRHIPDPL